MMIKGNWEDALKKGRNLKQANGIGTYKEKILHSTLKYYFEPDDSLHEIKIGRMVADICNEHGIIEIQTRSFNNLRKKLDLFLKDNTVTIVFPYAKTKWLTWLNPETGEVTKKRKSPKTGTYFEAFYELYKIKPYLSYPNIRFCFLGTEIEEIRVLNGWSYDKKRGSTRIERYPLKLIDTLYIASLDDFTQLIPSGMPSPFSTSDYSKNAHVSQKIAGWALNCLNSIGVIRRVGKKGNRILYEINREL
ncbi:MAG: hypothetical protein Q8873_05395 [Bacillota bacterium]|nr:hypothetical protein [Bacillota bacterium]